MKQTTVFKSGRGLPNISLTTLFQRYTPRLFASEYRDACKPASKISAELRREPTVSDGPVIHRRANK